MMDNSKVKLIVIADDRLWKSIIRDTYSTLALVLSVLVGWFLDSAALQWIAGVVVILFVCKRLINETKERMTIQEARQYLDNLERG